MENKDDLISSWDMMKIINAEPDADFTLRSRFFPQLSSCISGFVSGEVIVVSGYTGQGKTLFLEAITKDLEQQKIMTMWFSYEIRPKQLFRRFGQNVPLFMMPRKTKEGQKWLADKIREGVAKWSVKAVLIDHLHFIVDMIGASRLNRSDEIGRVMRLLKLLALELGICIFIVAHTTKPKGSNGDVLELGSVRDSSFIEQEADTVLYIWRATDKENGGFLKIAKDRVNGTWNKTIRLEKTYGVLKEVNEA